MELSKCGCGDQDRQGSCAGCQGEEEIFSYWCETCKRPVSEKRCPYCGLKAQRKRQDAAR